ncbi:YesL family protein, partial [Bacillus sp. JJ1474]|uniref:YesL family protein n=1 Tax=Bacillus sp. JJ1474 TaxID=3122955 RepID=UPI002FFE7CDE
MGTNGLMDFIYRASDWIIRLAYVNFLWMLFSILGLIIFGIFPSTVAMFTVLRQWIRSDKDIKVFKTFWSTFKSEFLKSNILGFILLGIGFILYIDFKFFSTIDGWVATILNLVLLSLFVIYAIVVLYIFPVKVHFELKTIQYFKYALVIGVSFPKTTLLIALSVLILQYIMSYITILIIFFLGSLIS